MNVCCAICSKNFDSPHSGSKYCSKQCWDIGHTRICEWCSKSFINKDKVRFCSRHCYSSIPRKPGCKISVCKQCKKQFDNGYEKRRKFCSKLCSGKYYANDRKIADWTKIKAGNRFTGVESILRINPVNRNKLLMNLGIGCSRCNWNEAICDIHHIRGRKIEDPDNHGNLSYLCPNCHRLAEKKKLKPEDLIPFSKQVGEKWRDAYGLK